ncbi:hypothetical protein PUNSTDRAFT_49916 [Punctularia strigosozonata HHB-11173 SS5]|uniref:uncharacterized protein n=1 Tax=Punctularia strigosozonata (strain HHB-11173) TaxID=741275 RepID=UPI0004418679|nr:uncharacterized protein PUNSTDRAFT_49916 [Punctularia strigosozonata HHB-11173 SS5]EIN12621.1 hypothetical protein PUNSTDRAFT_49916 [Punctularia strigosozonata HHB-11173 SS5]
MQTEASTSSTPYEPPKVGCPINELPTELLSHIFYLGTLGNDPEEIPEDEWETDEEGDIDGENGKPSTEGTEMIVEEDEIIKQDTERLYAPVLSFPVLVSHVCRRWRDVAINETPALWTSLDFREGMPFDKSAEWIKRSKGCPLDIDIDCGYPEEEDDDDDDDDMDAAPRHSMTDLAHIFALINPHVDRWRTLHLSVEEYGYMHLALVTLARLPPAPQLEVFQLYHYEESQDNAAFSPPELKEPRYLPFGGHAPKLHTVSLWGVHLDWTAALGMLSGLTDLELAWTAVDVRPSYAEFVALLRASPNLVNLSLCQSGPAGETEQDWINSLLEKEDGEGRAPTVFSDETVVLPSVKSLLLAFQEPEYSCALLRRLFFPSLKELTLDFDDMDYSALIEQLCMRYPQYGSASAPSSLLSGLEQLKLSGLNANEAAIRATLSELRNLKSINLNLEHLDIFWILALGHPIGTTFQLLHPQGEPTVVAPNPASLSKPSTSSNTPSSGPAEESRQVTGMYCPLLEQIYVSGLDGTKMRAFVAARSRNGAPLKRVYMNKEDDIETDDEEWLRENTQAFDYFSGSEDDDDVVEVVDMESVFDESEEEQDMQQDVEVVEAAGDDDEWVDEA